MSSTNEVAVAGVGMHPWGKWGHNFVTYGVHAALAALSDAGIPWEDVGFVSGADTMRNGYPGYVAGATFAQALGWTGVPVTSNYGACASGAMAIEAARARILSGRCDVALVVGADTTPKGFLAPQGGERTTDPDWLRFRLLGATNPNYFGMYARRRIDLFGATVDDFTAVKLKNAKHGLNNPYARYRKALVDPELMQPGVVYALRLDLWATSNVFLAGHRIRLEVSSSNFPRFARNSNTGGDVATEAAEAYRPAIQRVFHDTHRASRLILPIIARGN